MCLESRTLKCCASCLRFAFRIQVQSPASSPSTSGLCGISLQPDPDLMRSSMGFLTSDIYLGLTCAGQGLASPLLTFVWLRGPYFSRACAPSLPSRRHLTSHSDSDGSVGTKIEVHLTLHQSWKRPDLCENHLEWLLRTHQ